MVIFQISSFFIACVIVLVDGQCSVSPLCSVCDPAGRAVCGAICPKDIPLPTDIHYLEVANGTCDQWAKLGLIRPEYLLTSNDLAILNLTNAQVERFYMSPFINMPNLKQMYLSHNQIRGFTTTTWNGLSSLETLDLSYNNILGFTASIFLKLTALKELNLANNNINLAIPNTAFAGLTQLQTLKLSNNPITNLDSAIFQPLTHIVTIEMNSLNLTSLTSGLFSNLITLRDVLATHNQISSLADDCLSGTSLQKLDLSSNSLTAIPLTAVKNAAIQPKVVNLSYNKITHLSSTDLRGLSVGSLNFSGNPITTVTEDAFEDLRSYSIDLSYTGLTSLPSSTVAWLGDSTGTINLSNNNWQCDCTTLWLASLLQTKYNIISPTCTGKYAGHSLKDSWLHIRSDCYDTTPTTTTTATTTATTPTATKTATTHPAITNTTATPKTTTVAYTEPPSTSKTINDISSKAPETNATKTPTDASKCATSTTFNVVKTEITTTITTTTSPDAPCTTTTTTTVIKTTTEGATPGPTLDTAASNEEPPPL